MNHPALRFLTLVLIVGGFIAASSVLTALITSRRTDDALRFAITVQGFATLFGPPFLLLLFRTLTKSRLRRGDGFAAAAAIVAAVPVSVWIFSHVVSVVAGVRLSGAGIRLLTAGLVVCAIGSILASVKFCEKSNQAMQPTAGRRDVDV